MFEVIVNFDLQLKQLKIDIFIEKVNENSES